MKDLVEFEMKFYSSNAAFEENPSAEAARILREIADDVAAATTYCEGNVRDINGNTIGSFSFEVDEAEEDQDDE